jgi:enhancing lycopene biosynthesis protein 2
MNRAVAAIWSGMLIAATIGIVPIVVRLLSRTLSAANNIERYTSEILAGGIGIAENTANVAALKETIAIAPQLVAGAQSIERHAAAITSALGPVADTTGEGRS